MGQRLAVFDIGHTLVDGDPVILWARLLKARRRFSDPDAARLDRAVAACRSGRDSEAAAAELTDACAMAFFGRTEAQIRAEAGEAYAACVAPKVYAYATPLVARMRVRGYLSVGVTDGPAPLAVVIADALGLEAVFGTALAYDGDGACTGHAVWEAPAGWKVVRLAHLLDDADTDLPGSFGFADSQADVPLLERLGRPVLVNPSADLERRAISWGWPVVREEDPVVGTVEGLLRRDAWAGARSGTA